jgi:hypothetical protein
MHLRAYVLLITLSFDRPIGFLVQFGKANIAVRSIATNR